MMRTMMSMLITGLMVLSLAPTARALAPGEGVVHEGDSVPGIALGDTRAEVEASYGAPASCQSVEVAGDRGSCAFDVEGTWKNKIESFGDRVLVMARPDGHVEYIGDDANALVAKAREAFCVT